MPKFNYANLQAKEVRATLDNNLTYSKFDSMTPTSMELLEEKNMNSGYLLTILRLIDEFTIAKINGIRGEKYTAEYYHHLYEVLEMILDLIYCKMNPNIQKEFSIRLDNIRDEIDGIFSESEFGTFMNRNKGIVLRHKLGRMFRDMLINMEQRGMLTYKADDPRLAMGRFMD